MNKTDRMLAIVLELQRKRLLRAEDLEGLFETSVRTIYRDIQALSEAGVPIMGAPGTGYSLMEGYFLPPVSFTVEEAVSALIGTDFVEQKFDSAYSVTARTARGKIEAILPEQVRDEADRVRTTVRLLLPGKPDESRMQREEGIADIRKAILEERKIRFRYTKPVPGQDGSRETLRTAAPYGLLLIRGSWMLVAYCDLRREIRHFRVSRMSDLAVLDEPFTYPPDFRLHDYTSPDDRTMLSRIHVSREIADRVRESSNFYIESMEEDAEGLLVTFRIRQAEDLLQWVLGCGGEAVVLEPEELRDRVREEAEKIVKRYWSE